MRHAIVIEEAESKSSAFVPDLPGGIATGATVAEAEREMRAAIRFHLDGMREDGLMLPEPTAIVDHVDA